jgi:hypothetical protein
MRRGATTTVATPSPKLARMPCFPHSGGILAIGDASGIAKRGVGSGVIPTLRARCAVDDATEHVAVLSRELGVTARGIVSWRGGPHRRCRAFPIREEVKK